MFGLPQQSAALERVLSLQVKNGTLFFYYDNPYYRKIHNRWHYSSALYHNPSIDMQYFVYLLECTDKSIYTGITTDLARRFDEHKAGIGSRYTRAHGAKKMLYSERYKTRGDALRREAEIKRWPKKKKWELITSLH